MAYPCDLHSNLNKVASYKKVRYIWKFAIKVIPNTVAIARLFFSKLSFKNWCRYVGFHRELPDCLTGLGSRSGHLSNTSHIALAGTSLLSFSHTLAKQFLHPIHNSFVPVLHFPGFFASILTRVSRTPSFPHIFYYVVPSYLLFMFLADEAFYSALFLVLSLLTFIMCLFIVARHGCLIFFFCSLL